mmetsp:Transcript_845/g.2592  ORF Transcript_845/g.2592 Transcript_845/m.2592 type:complete len:256 (-) Transcript_845:854-1621(-)
MSKAQLLHYLNVLLGVLAILSLGDIAVSSFLCNQLFSFRSNVQNAINDYCSQNRLLEQCLSFSDFILAPYISFLIWSIFLFLSCMLLLYGITKSSTTSLSSFIYLELLLASAQIAFTTFVSVNVSYLKKSTTGASTVSYIDQFNYTVTKLWNSTSSWQSSVGCGGANKLSYKSEIDCVISVLDKYAITAACLMMFPVLLQFPAALFASLLRTWIVEDKGMDLFVQCRISQGFGLIIMGVFFFIICFGVVVCGIVL